MNILFVSSGNSGKVSPIVKKQGESLLREGKQIHFFLIHGKGFLGYLKNVYNLRQVIRKKQVDLIHAHYSLTAFVVSLTMFKPLVVSLMGSDLEMNKIFIVSIRFLSRYYWAHTIVKSNEMKNKLNVKNVSIIPNGVDINQFKPLESNSCKKKLGWVEEGCHVLFAANPERSVKNFDLLKKSVLNLQEFGYKIHIHLLMNVPHTEINIYMNAADVVTLTSLREGSPNVIKEAMACNRPIVVTDVGDTAWVIKDTVGCYVSGFSVKE